MFMSLMICLASVQSHTNLLAGESGGYLELDIVLCED